MAGFAGCLAGGVLDLVGVTRVRQDLNHEADLRPGVTGALTSKVETIERHLAG